MSKSTPSRMLAPIGSVDRWRCDDARAKDRLPAIYVCSSRHRPDARETWDPCEQEILRSRGILSGAYIGTKIILDCATAPMELARCSDLVLLGRLTVAGVPGGVILDGRKVLGTHEHQFAVLDHLSSPRHTLYERRGQRLYVLTNDEIRNTLDYLRTAIGPSRASAIRKEYHHACLQDLKHELQRDFGLVEALGVFGTGPRRDHHLAQKVAHDCLRAGWTKQKIRAYLTIYGFTNTSGTVGCWYADELNRLLETGSAADLSGPTPT